MGKSKLILCILIVAAVAAGVYYPFSGKSKMTVIGVLQFTANNLTTLEGFKDRMTELGYIEGDNVRYIFNGPIGKKADLAAEMQHLLLEKPDLIFTSPTPATLAARDATRDTSIPVVFAPVNDPLAAGLVTDIRRPGGNITGVKLGASDGRRLKWLKEISPAVDNVLIPYNAKGKSAITSYKNAAAAAADIGITITPAPVNSHKEIEQLLMNIPAAVDAVFLPRDGMVMSRIKAFSSVCIQRRLLLCTPRFKQVEAGALTGYGFIGSSIGRRAARLADLILKGADPGSLPIETAEDYLFLNLKTAAAIGLEIDDHIIRQAHTLVKAD